MVNEMSLLGAVNDPMLKDMSKIGAMRVDEVVNKYNLFQQILKILDTTSDGKLLQNTW